MSRQVGLVRFGFDAGCGGIQGPPFGVGSFEFVCTPDNHGVSAHTYGNRLGRDGEPLSGYFAAPCRAVMAGRPVHRDPEFEAFTYGDPTTPKRSLWTLRPGDILALYCGLQVWDAENGWDRDHRPALYLAGYSVAALAGLASDFDRKVVRAEFGRNFHVRYPSVFKRPQDDLVLVKGGPDSRLFRKAHRISGRGRDRAGSRSRCCPPQCRRCSATSGPRLDPGQPAPPGRASVRGQGDWLFEGAGVGWGQAFAGELQA